MLTDAAIRKASTPAKPTKLSDGRGLYLLSAPSGGNATTLAVIREVQKSGVSSLAGIARTLEMRGVKTPAGRSQWQPVQVSRLLSA